MGWRHLVLLVAAVIAGCINPGDGPVNHFGTGEVGPAVQQIATGAADLHLLAHGQPGDFVIITWTADCSTTEAAIGYKLQFSAEGADGLYAVVGPTPILGDEGRFNRGHVEVGSLGGGVATMGPGVGQTIRSAAGVDGWLVAVLADAAWDLHLVASTAPTDCIWRVDTAQGRGATLFAFDVPPAAAAPLPWAAEFAPKTRGWTHFQWRQGDPTGDEARFFDAQFPNGFQVRDYSRHSGSSSNSSPGRFAGTFWGEPGQAKLDIIWAGDGGGRVYAWHAPISPDDVPPVLAGVGYCDDHECRQFPT